MESNRVIITAIFALYRQSKQVVVCTHYILYDCLDHTLFFGSSLGGLNYFKDTGLFCCLFLLYVHSIL